MIFEFDRTSTKTTNGDTNLKQMPQTSRHERASNDFITLRPEQSLSSRFTLTENEEEQNSWPADTVFSQCVLVSSFWLTMYLELNDPKQSCRPR